MGHLMVASRVALVVLANLIAGMKAQGFQSWTLLDAMPRDAEAGEPCIRPERFAAFKLDQNALAHALSNVAREFVQDGRAAARISIPMPDGSLAAFDVVESPVLPDELGARFPNIRTYRGQGVADSTLNLRFDVTPWGFHGSILSNQGEIYIDPYTLRDSEHYASYYTRDHALSKRPFVCTTPHADNPPATRALQPGRSGAQLRTYRLACSMTGEATTTFSQQQGRASNVADGLAAVVTIINRANQILESEVAVRAVLISNNDQLIFTNPDTDPFTSPGDANAVNANHSTHLTTAIGFTNFDYAHVIHTGADFGNAGAIGTACSPTDKGLGMSSASPVPLDNLAVKLVCHEMGHQFGANHSYNSCFGGQSGPQQYAIEPGSGSTIMGYNGICSASENLQVFVDAMYNSGAYDQIIAYTTTGVGSGCPVVTQTGNTPPGIDAGADYIIPKSTPFTLTASGADADGDSLTYSWEDRAVGPSLNPTTADNGVSPIVRVRPPTASPSRTVPPLANILNGTTVVGERLPTQARSSWSWRATARDSRAAGGGVATDDIILTVASTAGPFVVTAPATGATVSGQVGVEWNVAGTNLSPVSTANVRILFSSDGGLTFPNVLAASVPNTGSANVLLPNVSTTQARIKVEAIGNVYFAISPGNFTTQFVPANVTLIPGGAIGVVDVAGNCNRNGFVDPGETGIALTIPVSNAGSVVGTSMVGTLSSLTPGVEVMQGSAAFGDLPFGGISSNANPFRIKVAGSHSCAEPIALRLTMAHAAGSSSLDVSVPTSFVSQPASFNYLGSRQGIPNPGARELAIPVAGLGGPVHDVAFAVTGTACSDTPGSATVGLVHTAVNQLAISLRNPTGTSVLLWDRNGGNVPAVPPNAARGDNLCNTNFSDAAPTSVTTLAAADGPYTGTWRPVAPLSAFTGSSPNGIWVARFEDLVSGESGSVLACRVTLRTRVCATPRCVADQDDGSGTGTPDGAVTIDDLLFFLVKFEEGSAWVDIDDGTGTGSPDGAVTIDDLLFDLTRFEAGC